MSDLTEQLKKGELPDNHHYYYRLPNGQYEVGNTFCLELLYNCKNGDKIKILHEVPTYEELQNQAFILKCRENEIVQLKELLKECREEIDYTGYNELGKEILLKKISQVLGDE